ncbi:MAG: transketolase [Eubacteriales bacterium]|nr:transketolase [Eubacteriales bacterium]
MDNLTATAFKIRQDILDTVVNCKAGHIGGDFSVTDILTTLYFQQMRIDPLQPKDPNRDRLILSKGHSVEALYAVLANRGFFPLEDLKLVSAYGSKYIGHPTTKVNGIEANSGSLGHGLSVGVGMALAGQMDQAPYRVYIVMGDGELAEGSVWEGAMAASHYQLDNLCAVIDRNGLQISGPTEDVMGHENLEARWTAFGWHVIKAAGNSTEAMNTAFELAKTIKGQPTVIIAETIKGYGVSFMENAAPWHHKVPNAEEYHLATAELAAKRGAAL